MPRVVEINVYPIKSCGRVECLSELVEARGLAHDRRYMVVDAEGGFLTQRRHPRMALIRIAEADTEGFTVEAPDAPLLRLPWKWPEGPSVEVTIWRGRVEATEVEGAAAAWFSAVLGLPCRLVYLAAHQHRAVPNQAAHFDDEVAFADGAPLLLISTASLEALNERLPTPVSMRRFRPNLVVTAETPFAEDGWRRLVAGEVELEVAWPCTRCVLTTVDPDSGRVDPNGEPLKTLRSFRRGPGGVLFGQNLIPRRLGRIGVGDLVETQ